MLLSVRSLSYVEEIIWLDTMQACLEVAVTPMKYKIGDDVYRQSNFKKSFTCFYKSLCITVNVYVHHMEKLSMCIGSY